MIRQGTNKPLAFVFQNKVHDIHITLFNETGTIKQWDTDGADLVTNSTERTKFWAMISQAESKNWPEGPCCVEVRWNYESTSDAGTEHKKTIHDCIGWTQDKTALDEDIDDELVVEEVI